MRRTGYRPHDRAWAPRGKVLWLLAAMLATLFFAPLHPLQADEVPQKSTHAFLGAETDNTGEIACSVVPRRPEEGETFTLKFDVTEYTGEHKVFAKYTITKDGSSEKKSGNSNFDYTNNGDVTLQTSVSLDDGNYVFKCHLWEDGSIGWFSSGNVSMEKSDTVNFEVLPPASGDVACDTDPTVPKSLSTISGIC